MNKTNYEFYKYSPQLMAELLASAYIAGFISSKKFKPEEIELVIWDKELTNKLINSYLQTLNSQHPTYLGKAD